MTRGWLHGPNKASGLWPHWFIINAVIDTLYERPLLTITGRSTFLDPGFITVIKPSLVSTPVLCIYTVQFSFLGTYHEGNIEKLPKSEIFVSSDFHDFFNIKSLWV